MKNISTIGISLLLICVVGILISLPANNKVKPAKPSTSVTVKCKDSSEYTDKLSYRGNFKCDWKELTFNL